MSTDIKLYSTGYKEAKTYLFASIFVAGNILLPQLCHLVSQGGFIFLPIYFFTLVAAYKFGWKVGLLTAVASPVVNFALFGMPAAAVLPAILLKSTVLALAAAWCARKWQRVALLPILVAIAAYQIVGTLGEWAMSGSIVTALQDFRLGVPGMLLQLFGGWAVLKCIRNI